VAAETGYSHVSLRLIPTIPEEVCHPIVGDTTIVRAVERLLAETGIRGLDVDIFWLTLQVRTPHFEPVLATVARVGARRILVAGNDADESRLRDSFADLCAVALRYGLNACLESMP
jgi:hypothetical protein